MNSPLISLACAAFLAGPLHTLNGAARHNGEFGGGWVFPVSGYVADRFHSGPAWRAGYEARWIKYLGAEAGFTQASLPARSCNRFGCTYPREALKLLDYGLRAVAPLAASRVELSLGVGGGYVWQQYGDSFTNGHLFQYSGKAAVALDRRHHLRVAVTVRTWRDLGRPVQQWLSTTGSVVYGFGGRP